MSKQTVIAIVDVGKTNKKFFLFNEEYKIVFERCEPFFEARDEDGDPCENLDHLRFFVFDSLHEVLGLKDFEIKAINFCSYGASFVYLNNEGKECAPLYNYLKKYPENLKKQFYDCYGGEEKFSFQTASPVLESLNSGMQLYRMKYEKPDVFKKIKYALHLPQYLSYLITSQAFSDITSIGCHTNLWNFQKNEYHKWVEQEGILEKLAPIFPSNHVVGAFMSGRKYSAGIGLHDSSAALIPYLLNFEEPFVLISTGTWCISLNSFNQVPLTKEELENDCLCYMTFEGEPVKASRLFAGYEHEIQVKRIAEHFNQNPARYSTMDFNSEIITLLKKRNSYIDKRVDKNNLNAFAFEKRELSDFTTDVEAYHQLMLDIILQQFLSTGLVLKGTKVKKIFVDGGFSKNVIYMNLLACYFSEIGIFGASVSQATAMGAALAIHDSWNKKSVSEDIITIENFSSHPSLFLKE